MASVKKYSRDLAALILNHNSRNPSKYKNKDVDRKRSRLNVTLFDKGVAGYKKRIDDLYVRKQKDVKTLCEWVVTCPAHYNERQYIKTQKDAAGSAATMLLTEVSKFLSSRYGEDNAIQSIIHFDESGEPHLHFTFVPAVEDPKKHKDSGMKVSSRDVINRTELRRFHGDLRDYLNSSRMLDPMLFGSYPGNDFYTGVTAAQGGNRSVEQLKSERELQREIERLQWQLDQIQTLKIEKDEEEEWEI